MSNTFDYSPLMIDSDLTFDLGFSRLQLSDDTVPESPPTYPHQYPAQTYNAIPPQYLASEESYGIVDPSLMWNGALHQSTVTSELMFALEPQPSYPATSSPQYYSTPTILIPPYAPYTPYEYLSGSPSSSSSSSDSFSILLQNPVEDFSFSNYVHDQWN